MASRQKQAIAANGNETLGITALYLTREGSDKLTFVGRGKLSFLLKIHINPFAILVHCSPQVVQLTVDLYENFIDIEGIAMASMLSFQYCGVGSPEFEAPPTDGFIADSDASLSQEVFNISMTQVEAIAEPDGVTDDIGRKPVKLVGIHGASLANSTD
jgi:hypothetical protein